MSTDERQINMIHTPCKNCVFAIYENSTQENCAMGLLEKFQKAEHIDVLEAFDEEAEFFIISKKKCHGYKEQKYFVARDIQDLTIEEKVEYVKESIKLRYVAFIDCKNRTPEQLSDVLNCLKKADIKPSSIVVVTNQQNVKDMNEFYKALNKSKIGCKWRIKSLAYDKQDHITTVHQEINVGSQKCNFVLSIQDDYQDIDKLVNIANKIAYIDFKTFRILSNKSKQSLFFNVSVYKAALLDNKDIITDEQEYTIV